MAAPGLTARFATVTALTTLLAATAVVVPFGQQNATAADEPVATVEVLCTAGDGTREFFYPELDAPSSILFTFPTTGSDNCKDFGGDAFTTYEFTLTVSRLPDEDPARWSMTYVDDDGNDADPVAVPVSTGEGGRRVVITEGQATNGVTIRLDLPVPTSGLSFTFTSKGRPTQVDVSNVLGPFPAAPALTDFTWQFLDPGQFLAQFDVEPDGTIDFYQGRIIPPDGSSETAIEWSNGPDEQPESATAVGDGPFQSGTFLGLPDEFTPLAVPVTPTPGEEYRLEVMAVNVRNADGPSYFGFSDITTVTFVLPAAPTEAMLRRSANHKPEVSFAPVAFADRYQIEICSPRESDCSWQALSRGVGDGASVWTEVDVPFDSLATVPRVRAIYDVEDGSGGVLGTVEGLVTALDYGTPDPQVISTARTASGLTRSSFDGFGSAGTEGASFSQGVDSSYTPNPMVPSGSSVIVQTYLFEEDGSGNRSIPSTPGEEECFPPPPEDPEGPEQCFEGLPVYPAPPCTWDSGTGRVALNQLGNCAVRYVGRGTENIDYSAAPDLWEFITITEASADPVPSASASTIGASPSTVVADGVASSTVTVRLKDGDGNDITSGGATVTLATSLGTLSVVTDNGDGTYTATLTSTVAGTATITGTVGGAAISGSATVTVTKVAQTITAVDAPTDPEVGGTFTPSATSDSGLTVGVGVSGSACSLTGGQVSFIAAGECTITYAQPGDDQYAAAADVVQTFTVSAAVPVPEPEDPDTDPVVDTPQTITVTTPVPTDPEVGDTFTPAATASSGLPVTVTVAAGSASVCAIDGNGLVTFVTVGDCVILYDQAGGEKEGVTYEAAPQVSETVTVIAASGPGDLEGPGDPGDPESESESESGPDPVQEPVSPSDPPAGETPVGAGDGGVPALPPGEVAVVLEGPDGDGPSGDGPVVRVVGERVVIEDGDLRVEIGGDLPFASGGTIVAREGGTITCVVCGEAPPGAVVTAWLFSEPRLVAAGRVGDDGCVEIVIPLAAPLDGGGSVAAGEHTLQLVVPRASGGRVAVNVGVVVGGPVPTGIPAGGGPSSGDLPVPLGLFLAPLLAVMGVVLVGRRTLATC